MDSADAAPGETRLPPTAPENILVNVQGFPDEASAKRMGHAIAEVVRACSCHIDVGTLDGITVAVDYDEALRTLDRGIEGLREEARTNDEELVGVAKSVTVKRGDLVKTHLVFLAGPVSCLASDDVRDEDFKVALAVIAHECAHVEEFAWREERFPGTVLAKRYHGFVPAYTMQFAESFWCEYAACRLSAMFAPDEGPRFRESLAIRLRPVDEKVREAIVAYRTHGDVQRVFEETAAPLLEPLRAASYLFGHLDGRAENALPDPRAEFSSDDEAMTECIATLVGQLRSLWDRREKWEHLEDMFVLGETAFDVLRQHGVDVQPHENGQAYIDVPYTLDTLPPGLSAYEFMHLQLRGGL